MTRFSLMTMIAAYARVYERTLAAAGVHLPPLGREAKPPPASSQATPLQSASNP